MQIEPGDDDELPSGFVGGQHQVIWTLPYASETNPIEQIWARGKEHVRVVADANSTPATVRAALIDCFLGSAHAGAEGCTPAFCQRLICHTRAVLDRWVAESPRLSALIPGATKDLAALTADVRAAYGPVARAHRRLRRGKGDCAADGDATDDDSDSGGGSGSDSEEEEGDVAGCGGVVVEPPEEELPAPAPPAPALPAGRPASAGPLKFGPVPPPRLLRK